MVQTVNITNHVTLSDLRQSISTTFQKVSDDHVTTLVTKGKKAVVMLSMEEFNTLNETLYLMSTKTNRERLLSSIDDVEKGKNIIKDSRTEW